MYPVLFRIGPVSIYSWGFMAALGFLTGLFTAMRFGRRERIKEETILDLFVYVVISAIVGARLFYVAAFFPQYRNDPISIFYVSEGGLVFLGGLLAALAVVLVYVRHRKLNIMRLLDALSPAAAVGYAIGRIGCFLNGCCYGIKIFGFEQPTQIYSSVSGFIIFAVLVHLYNKKKYDGQIFLFALLLYSTYRFFIEFIRYSPLHIFIFTPSQLLVIVIFTFSSYALWKKNTT